MESAQTKWYKKRKSMGICVDCGGELDRQGVRCVSCRKKKTEEDKKSREMYRKMGVCPVCRRNKILGEEKTCPECLAQAAIYVNKNRAKMSKAEYNSYMRSYSERTYRKRKESGICTRCGKRKATEGYFTCYVCRTRDTEQKRLRNAPKIPRNERYLHGICFFCDNPVEPGWKTCEVHHKMCADNATCENAKKARERLRKEGILY